MPTLYVSNSTVNGFAVGSNANSYAQAQSKATPFLTIAFAHAQAVAGDTILINDGTYPENSGSNFLALNRAFASTTTFQGFSSNASLVKIQSTGTVSFEMRLNGASNVTLRYVTIDGQATTTGGSVTVQGNSTNSNVTFDNCIFNVAGANITNATGAFIYNFTGATTTSLTGLTISNCVIQPQTGQFCGLGIYMFTQSPAVDTCSGWTLTNNTITLNNTVGNGQGAAGIYLLTVTNFIIRNNFISMTNQTASSYGISVGVDGFSNPAGNISGDIAFNYVYAPGTTNGPHEYLIGAGADATHVVTVRCNTGYGGQHGYVLKGHTGVGGCVMTNNHHVGTIISQDGILWKGTVGDAASGDLLVVQANSAGTMALKTFNSAPFSSGLTIRGQIAIAQNYAVCGTFNYGNETVGGTICDCNVHVALAPAGTSTNVLFGVLFANTGFNTQAQLAAQWAANANYTSAGNDAHSIVSNSQAALNVSVTGKAAGQTVYFVVKNGANYWNSLTQAFEAYNASNWWAYALPTWEQSSGNYVSALPPQAAGGSVSAFYTRAKTAAPNPADSAPLLATGVNTLGVSSLILGF